FQDDVGFLDLRKAFEKGRPFSKLFLPFALINIKSPSHVNGRNRFLFGKVGNLFATSFVLDERALACELVDRLLVCRIGDQPERVANRTIVVVDGSLRCHARGWWPLKTGPGHEFGIVEIVITNSGLRLYVPHPIYIGTAKRTECC